MRNSPFNDFHSYKDQPFIDCSQIKSEEVWMLGTYAGCYEGICTPDCPAIKIAQRYYPEIIKFKEIDGKQRPVWSGKQVEIPPKERVKALPNKINKCKQTKSYVIYDSLLGDITAGGPKQLKETIDSYANSRILTKNPQIIPVIATSRPIILVKFVLELDERYKQRLFDLFGLSISVKNCEQLNTALDCMDELKDYIKRYRELRLQPWCNKNFKELPDFPVRIDRVVFGTAAHRDDTKDTPENLRIGIQQLEYYAPQIYKRTGERPEAYLLGTGRQDRNRDHLKNYCKIRPKGKIDPKDTNLIDKLVEKTYGLTLGKGKKRRYISSFSLSVEGQNTNGLIPQEVRRCYGNQSFTLLGLYNLSKPIQERYPDKKDYINYLRQQLNNGKFRATEE